MSEETLKELVENLQRDPDGSVGIETDRKNYTRLAMELFRNGKSPRQFREELTVIALNDDLYPVFIQTVFQVMDILLGGNE